MVDYSVLVSEFSKRMLERLVEKERKYGDSWLKVPVGQLRIRLLLEFGEWKDSWYDLEKEMNELVDIANQALLLYYRLKKVNKG